MIVGKLIRLRAIEREDISRFVRWMNDPEVICYTTTNTPFSTAMEEKWFERQLDRSINLGQILAIETQVGEEWIHIGSTDLFNIEPIDHAAEFGIMIGDKDFWNKGLGREATRLMLKHGFEDLNLNRIYLQVFAENLRGIKAYLAAGFVKEGILRQAMYKNGKYNDIVLMSVLHIDWKGFDS
jgi:RimJ/RimL family protein N-acetyltransferase